MSARDDLQAGLQRVVAGIGGLGDRPAGDPAVLAQLAHDVEQHAGAAATLVGRETAIPADITLEGEGARRLAALADLPPEVSGNLRDAARQLRRSAIAAERQAIFLSWRAHRGLLAEGPAGARGRTSLPQLLSPRLILREGTMPPPRRCRFFPAPARSDHSSRVTRRRATPLGLRTQSPS